MVSNEYKIANRVGRFGIMLYGILRFLEDVILNADSKHGISVIIICIVTTATLTILQNMMKDNKYVPLMTGVFIMGVFLVGAIFLRDFGYYFMSMLCVVGIVCIYQNFRAVIIFFIISLCVNIPLYFSIYQNPSFAVLREMVIDGILFVYGFVFLLILVFRLSVRNTAARSSEDAFSSLLKTTPNMTLIVDDMRKVTFISEMMAAFADVPAKYAVGRPVLDLFRDFEVKLWFADIIETEGYFEDVRKLEINGMPYYFKIVCDRLIGKAKGMFIDVADVTATVEAKLEAEQEKENAVAANVSKSKFLATMSHEIRTPMNAIIGISQMQMSREDLPPESINAISQIYTSGHGLLGIINDILDLSKIETGKLEILPVEYDLPSLIHDSVTLNITRIGSKPIEFKLDVSADVPSRIFGDELRLKQILNNLLSNAFKYTDEGQVSMHVSHQDTKDGIHLIFAIADTGQGMKKEDAEALGNEFARFNMDANRATEGTGLGMSITKRLIRLMEGSLVIESEYGVGSTFTVTIPQKAVSDSRIGEELAAKLQNFTFSREKDAAKLQIVREYMPYGRVLVVDDVETNLYVAEGLLAPYGLKVETVTSGFATIDLVNDGNTYDIIFMDHMMPRMDGIETTEKLREAGYKAPIVALTANAIAGNDVMFKSKGFDDFISKPIDIRQMDAVLHHFVHDPEKARKQIPPTVSLSEAGHQNLPTVNSSIAGHHSPSTVNPSIAGHQNTSMVNPFIAGQHSPSMVGSFVSDSHISPKLAEAFVRDAKSAVIVLRDWDKEDLKLFTTTAHAMKSACANVGNGELSALAKELETAGREGNRTYIASNAVPFAQQLEKFMQTFIPKQSEDDALSPLGYAALYRDTLEQIAAACEDYDSDTAEKLIDTLRKYRWSEDEQKYIDDISVYLLHAEFEEAAEAIRTSE
jgi:signal transduction histidine kinase/FixJ family two-component response regulator/HPt (histidine-containing phosphotransfer) domain-containing protein